MRSIRSLLGAAIMLPAGLAMNYVLNLVLARSLPVKDYGLFGYAQSLATMLALAAALGFSSSMMRWIPTYRSQEQWGLLQGVVKSSFALICFSAMCVGSVLFSLTWLMPQYRSSLIWVILLLLPLTVDAWRESSMRGLHRVVEAILPRQVLLPFLTVTLVFLLGLQDIFWIFSTYIGLLVVLESAGLIRLYNLLAGVTKDPPRWSVGKWLRVSVPMGMAALARLGMNRWDIVIVGAMVSLDSAGRYTAAARTALLTSLVVRVVNLVVGPMLAELYHSGQYRRFRRLIIHSILGSAAVGFPLYLLIMLFPETVLRLFGSGYVEATSLLQVLATGQFVNLIMGPIGLALIMSRYERPYLIVVLLASVLSLMGMVLLGQTHGAFGVACASAGGTAFLSIGSLILFYYSMIAA